MFTNNKKSDETEMLQLSLATPADMEVIALLSSRYGHGMPDDVRTELPVARPAFAVSALDQVIKATNSKGDIVASLRLGIAETVAELNAQFETVFPWTRFPVMTLKEACSLPKSDAGKALRFLSLQLANLMEINDVPICAQIGEIVGFNALEKFDVNILPPRKRPAYVGQEVHSSTRVGNVVYKADFRDAIEELLEDDVPMHRWVGSLPFEHCFEPSVASNLKKVLQFA